MFSKFAEKQAFMLECNTAYIANLYLDSDYMSIASNAQQKVNQIVLRKRKNLYIVQYLISGIYVSFSP